MAYKFDIRESDRWFTNTDYTIKYRIYAEDGVTPENAAGYAFSWMLKRRPRDPDASALLTKTTPTITIIGVFDSDPAVNTQRVTVFVPASDTDGDFKSGVYFHELKRTDTGIETVYSQGSAKILDSAHRS